MTMRSIARHVPGCRMPTSGGSRFQDTDQALQFLEGYCFLLLHHFDTVHIHSIIGLQQLTSHCGALIDYTNNPTYIYIYILPPFKSLL